MQSLSIDTAAWDSPWRAQHVGEKALLSVGLVLVALVTPPWPGSVLVAVTSLVAMLGLARIPVKVVALAMLAPLAFLLLGAVVVAIGLGDAPSDAWFSWWLLSIGPDGAAQAANILGHGLSGTLAILVLATTTPMVDLFAWLRSLGVPAALLDIANLTYKALFITLTTVVTGLRAQRMRLGDDPRGGQRFRRRYRNLASLIGTVALRSWDRANRLNRGLELRGFEDDLKTLPRRVRTSWRFIVVTILTLAGIVLVSWWL